MTQKNKLSKAVDYTPEEMAEFDSRYGDSQHSDEAAPQQNQQRPRGAKPKEQQDDLEDLLRRPAAEVIPPGAQGVTEAREMPRTGASSPPPAEGAAEAQKPSPEANAKAEVMMTRYEYIESCLKTKSVTGKLTVALGYQGKDEAGKSEAHKYIASVLIEIKKTETGPGADHKKVARDLTYCHIDSIVESMIDAANFRLPIDGRKLAYLVKYENRAQFQVGYKGMLYKLAELYRDVDFTAEPVFEGDVLTLSDKGGFQTYEHERPNPFEDDVSKMIGLICCLCYTSPSGLRSKTAAVPRSEVDKIRGKAKQKFIWDEWFLEKAKAAGLKRLCKIHFATAMGLQALIDFDNERNFDMDAVSTPNGDRISPMSGEDLAKRLEHKPQEAMPPVSVVTTEKEKVQ